MTPLAQQIARAELAAPKAANRWFADLGRSDCRCFEVTAVRDLMQEFMAKAAPEDIREQLTFLPAPYTWIEWLTGEPNRVRLGVLLEAVEAGDTYTIESKRHIAPRGGFLLRFAAVQDGKLTSSPKFFMRHGDDGRLRIIFDQDSTTWHSEDEYHSLGCLAVCALAIINSPHIVGRRTHLPHAGLQREMARARKMTGKFPLQAWTEIILDLTPPREALDDGHEAHLTGGRALHFCRAHLRVRLGKLEYVRWHWRGDPSNGIKRSRYTVKPPRPGAGQAAA